MWRFWEAMLRVFRFRGSDVAHAARSRLPHALTKLSASARTPDFFFSRPGDHQSPTHMCYAISSFFFSCLAEIGVKSHM